MNSHSRQRLVALVLSLVPGWGHVYWGREFLGLAVFTGCAVFAFAFINANFVYQGDGREVLLWISGIVSLFAFLATWIELFFRTSPARVSRDREERRRLLHQGTIAYLKCEYANASVLFRQCLRIDSQDIEALFRLGVTCARRGDEKQARRWLRRLLRFDLEEKWRWEANRELCMLGEKEGEASASPPPARNEEEAEAEEEAEPTSA